MFGVPHVCGIRLCSINRGRNQISCMQAWYAQKVPQLVKMSARSLSVRNVSMISLGASRTLRWRWWRLSNWSSNVFPFLFHVPSGNNSHSELENGPLKTWIYVDLPIFQMVDLSIVFWDCLPGRVKIVKQRKSRDWTSSVLPARRAASFFCLAEMMNKKLTCSWVAQRVNRVNLIFVFLENPIFLLYIRFPYL